MQKRGVDMTRLDEIIAKLASGEVLDEQYRDHALSGNYIGHRECHIAPDWLLVYYKENDILVLTLARTGSHSDLF
jgi:mRNA interferase YafQ